MPGRPPLPPGRGAATVPAEGRGRRAAQEETAMSYPSVQLYINGAWRAARSGKTGPVINPATEEVIGTYAYAAKEDLDEALEAAAKGFAVWKKVSAFDRSKVMRKAADIL